MRKLSFALLFLLLSAGPLLAQQFGPEPDAATKSEILKLREAAWRAWFNNDTADFKRIVPEELVALSSDGGEWTDRVQTMAGMKDFAKGGKTIKSLEFPRNIFQRYNDVVILYTRFKIVLVDRAGAAQETVGRGTEIFVRRNGHWIHTGWHLDTMAG